MSRVRRTAFRLHLEYDGGRYQGWQRQSERQTEAGVRTVAGSLERVLTLSQLRPLTLVGSGRTDAGVHALDQVAHLHLPSDKAPSPAHLHRVLGEGLPSDIVVTRVTPCTTSFHARHDAEARTYLYCLTLRRTAFAKPWVWWIKPRLDLGRLQEALHLFEGFHDMAAFADLEPGDESRCEVQACEMECLGSMVLLRIRASHFLRRQVRRMVGAAVQCALGETSPSRLREDLSRPSPARTLHWAERAAPASGLFLAKVHYPDDPESAPPLPWFNIP